MVCAAYFAHLCCGLSDALDEQHLVLYLSEFDAETAQLDLEVDASDVFEVALLVVAADVTGVIHLYGSSVGVFVDERAFAEGLCGAFRQLPVASSHLYAGEAQFSGDALRHQSSLLVDDEVVAVGDRFADGDVVDMCARLYFIIRGVVGALCGSIDVDDLDVVAEDAVEFLASGGDEAHGEVIVGVEQECCDGCCVAAACDAVVEEELPDGAEVLAYLGGHNVEGSSECEDGVHILDMCIEGEGTVSADAVVGREVFHVDDHVDEVP